MNRKTFGIALMTLLLAAETAGAQITIRGLGGRGRQETERTKTIHGIVQDMRGKPIAGARVLIRSTKDNTTRTATTDAQGNYAVRGLPFDSDYEVRADFKGEVSELKTVSALLDREDNLLNFQLNVTVIAEAAAPKDNGPELQTFDLVKLKASFELPRGVPAPIPVVLLLHGYGEDRKVWDSFRAQLLEEGWAVMALDLRGHGDSTIRNQRPFTAKPEWRSSSHEFPHDLDPALDWLKAQPRLDSRKIVVIGSDIGANLALFASGKFKEVRTVVAVNPNLQESLGMAGSAQDFKPRSALLVTADEGSANAIRESVAAPVRVQTLPLSGGTAAALQNKQLTDAIFQWLKETY